MTEKENSMDMNEPTEALPGSDGYDDTRERMFLLQIMPGATIVDLESRLRWLRDDEPVGYFITHDEMERLEYTAAHSRLGPIELVQAIKAGQFGDIRPVNR